MTGEPTPSVADRVRRDYDAAARDYDDLVRHDDSSTHDLSTAMITAFAAVVRSGDPVGPVLDAGCGPGQWTALLADLGLSTSGVDLSPEMIAIARRHRPDLPFTVGSLLHTGLPDRSLAGILAHFSLIHLPPDELPAVWSEFDRLLRRGAPLLVGVQVAVSPGPQGWTAYDEHRASPAWTWDLAALADGLRAHGFTEIARMRIEPIIPDRPPAGYLLVRAAS